jgi:hypothetical protein
MIVWSGKGFVAVLVFVACMVVFTRILATEQFDYALMLSFLLQGHSVGLWAIGGTTRRAGL